MNSIVKSLVVVSTLLSTSLAATDAKRGVVFMPNNAADTSNWADSTLGWYYNYGTQPDSQMSDAGLEFVPMVWGDKDGMKENFIPNVEKLSNVKYALGMNEPDIIASYGGSDQSVGDAVTMWRQYVQPLAARGIKLGTPAVSSSPAGTQWIKNFINACTDCEISFIALHYYGDFAGLASHLGEYHAAFPTMKLWLTEFADSNDALDSTISNTQQMLDYMDKLDYVERYAYFGAVRANVCNVGPNAALMDNNGALNSLGKIFMTSSGVSSPDESSPSPALIEVSTAAAPTTPPVATTPPTVASVPTVVPVPVASPVVSVPAIVSKPAVYTPKKVFPTTLRTSYKAAVTTKTATATAKSTPKKSSSSSTTHKHHHHHHHSSKYAHRYATSVVVVPAVATVTDVAVVTVYA